MRRYVLNKSLTTLEEKDKNFYRSFIEGKGKNFIAFVAQAGQLKYVNEIIEELLGYSPQEVLASDFDMFSLISPEHRRMARENYLIRLRDSSIPPKAEINLLTKANTKLPAILYAEIIDYQGRKAIQGLIVDISERKKIERKLKRKEERYSRLLEESPNLIVNINESGQIHYINRTFLNILGADNFEDKFEGRPFWTLISPEHVKDVKARFEAKFIESLSDEIIETSTVENLKLSSPETIEFSLKTLDGTKVPIIARISISELDEGNILQCIMERNYRKSLMKLVMPEIFLSILSYGELGSETVQTEELPFEKEDEGFLIKTGIYLMATIGMGSEHFLGLSGPLPVSGWPNYFQFVYSFKISSLSQTDKRMEGKDFCLLLLFGPRDLEHLFSDRKTLKENIRTGLEKFEELEDLKKEGAIEYLKRWILLQEKD